MGSSVNYNYYFYRGILLELNSSVNQFYIIYRPRRQRRTVCQVSSTSLNLRNRVSAFHRLKKLPQQSTETWIDNQKAPLFTQIFFYFSFPRRRESSLFKSFWIPAFAGMT